MKTTSLIILWVSSLSIVLLGIVMLVSSATSAESNFNIIRHSSFRSESARFFAGISAQFSTASVSDTSVANSLSNL